MMLQYNNEFYITLSGPSSCFDLATHFLSLEICGFAHALGYVIK